jgi:glyoxalase family protein
MVHTVEWRVGSTAALDFWERRLSGLAEGVARDEHGVTFDDFEGLRHRLVASSVDDVPLLAEHPEIPAEHALQGFDGVRAYAALPDASRPTLEETLGFVPAGIDTWEARGPTRGGRYAYETPPAERGLGGAGTVHHIAWSSTREEHADWHARVATAGLQPSPIIDRFWFSSIYFREPNGILFEIATTGPGFSVDEDTAALGERLILPPAFEALRDRIEPALTPLPDPRPWARTG